MADESPEQVFEALLAEWRESESAIIGERSRTVEAHEAAADREADEWRHRFATAYAWSSSHGDVELEVELSPEATKEDE